MTQPIPHPTFIILKTVAKVYEEELAFLNRKLGKLYTDSRVAAALENLGDLQEFTAEIEMAQDALKVTLRKVENIEQLVQDEEYCPTARPIMI